MPGARTSSGQLLGPTSPASRRKFRSMGGSSHGTRIHIWPKPADNLESTNHLHSRFSIASGHQNCQLGSWAKQLHSIYGMMGLQHNIGSVAIAVLASAVSEVSLFCAFAKYAVLDAFDGLAAFTCWSLPRYVPTPTSTALLCGCSPTDN